MGKYVPAVLLTRYTIWYSRYNRAVWVLILISTGTTLSTGGCTAVHLIFFYVGETLENSRHYTVHNETFLLCANKT